MLFSIIVPIYNVEAYLERCVDSLINQTYRDIEIILVDDGSPDGCPAICDNYQNKDKRVKVIHKANGGLSDARNAGIREAHGDYLIFVDSDDYIETDSCEKLSVFATKGFDVIVADAIVEGGICPLAHMKTSDVMTGMEYLKRACRTGKAPMAAWLNIIRRSFIIENELLFKKGILHEDEEFTPRLYLNANSVVCSDVFFYHYLIRENSITNKKNKRKNAVDLYNTCLELEEVYKKIDDAELRDNLKDSLVNKYLSLFNDGKIYQYGKEFYHKRFMMANAKHPRTICKVVLYSISPRLYCWVNKITKR